MKLGRLFSSVQSVLHRFWVITWRPALTQWSFEAFETPQTAYKTFEIPETAFKTFQTLETPLETLETLNTANCVGDDFSFGESEKFLLHGRTGCDRSLCQWGDKHLGLTVWSIRKDIEDIRHLKDLQNLTFWSIYMVTFYNTDAYCIVSTFQTRNKFYGRELL